MIHRKLFGYSPQTFRRFAANFWLFTANILAIRRKLFGDVPQTYWGFAINLVAMRHMVVIRHKLCGHSPQTCYFVEILLRQYATYFMAIRHETCGDSPPTLWRFTVNFAAIHRKLHDDSLQTLWLLVVNFAAVRHKLVAVRHKFCGELSQRLWRFAAYFAPKLGRNTPQTQPSIGLPGHSEKP